MMCKEIIRSAPVTRGVRGALVAMLVSFAAVACSAGAPQQGPTATQSQVEKNAQLEKNKELVIGFYKALFDERNVAEAFRKYATPNYIQHSPLADDVPTTITFLQNMLDNLPQHGWELKRVIAEGDLVFLFVHSWNTPGDPGRAIGEIFRVENGRVAEHWEVMQTVVKMEGRSMF